MTPDGDIEAYLRMYRADGRSGVAQVGRVLTIHHRCGDGAKLMHFVEKTALERFGAKEICMDAQKTAEGHKCR